MAVVTVFVCMHMFCVHGLSASLQTAITKHHRMNSTNSRKGFSELWRLEVQDGQVSVLFCCELVSSHGGRGKEALCGLFRKATNPSPEDSTFMT